MRSQVLMKVIVCTLLLLMSNLTLIFGNKLEFESMNKCNNSETFPKDISTVIINHQNEISDVQKALEGCSDDFKFGKKNSESLKNEVNVLKRKLSELTSLVHHIESTFSIVSPAFEWAESPTHVYIGVKFAHKLDTPACIDVVKEVIEIKENSIKLEAECRGQKKKFELEIELHDKINKPKSSWNLASVGRGTFTLEKQTDKKWNNLFHKNATPPRNMHSWWELKEKYDKEFDRLDRDNKKKEQSEALKDSWSSEAEEILQEKTDDDKVKKKERKKAKKLAKTERNKLKRHKKKLISELDAELKEEIEKIESKFNGQKDKISKETELKLVSLQDELENTLEEIMSSKEPNESIFSKITSFFSSSFGTVEETIEKEEV